MALEFCGDALGMTTIGYSPVGSREMPMECRFKLLLASGHYFDPALHRWSRIGTGDSPLYRRWNICYLSLLFLTDSLAE
ncbi:hypothetical protein HAX54_041233, partial [Datura stramonium]|nr:hypothetical protein [Datura stramonium]